MVCTQPARALAGPPGSLACHLALGPQRLRAFELPCDPPREHVVGTLHGGRVRCASLEPSVLNAFGEGETRQHRLPDVVGDADTGAL